MSNKESPSIWYNIIHSIFLWNSFLITKLRKGGLCFHTGLNSAQTSWLLFITPIKTVITEKLGSGLYCKLRLWLVSFSSSQIFQSGFVYLKPTSYMSQWQVSACNYLFTSHSVPHKKHYQVCIFKTNELLVNTFEAINQQYHFLSTDRDIVAFKFLHGVTHTSRIQTLLVCSVRQGCRWRSHKWPVH